MCTGVGNISFQHHKYPATPPNHRCYCTSFHFSISPKSELLIANQPTPNSEEPCISIGFPSKRSFLWIEPKGKQGTGLTHSAGILDKRSVGNYYVALRILFCSLASIIISLHPWVDMVKWREMISGLNCQQACEALLSDSFMLITLLTVHSELS